MDDRPGFVDLFAGCGGITLGLRHAGLRPLLAVEADRAAAASHGAVHHPGNAAHAAARDVTSDLAVELASMGLDPGDVHLIAGGPPCQAFTRLGRARLAAARGRQDAWLVDERAELFRAYLHWVDVVRPRAVLVENVPDCLRHGDRNVAATIAAGLRALGYEARYTLLNAARYGVPQWRERMFLLVIRADLGIEPTFPAPTHSAHGEPTGYRAVALKGVADDDPFYVPAPAAAGPLPTPITAAEAIGDLPFQAGHLAGRRPPKVEERIPWSEEVEP